MAENGGKGPPPGQEVPPVADPTGPEEGGCGGGGQGKAPERLVTSYVRILPDVTASSGLLEVVEEISASGPEVARAGVKERGVCLCGDGGQGKHVH